MSSVSDTVSSKTDDEAETPRQEQKIEPGAELIEMGSVSDTRGGWLGSKFDSGIGFVVY